MNFSSARVGTALSYCSKGLFGNLFSPILACLLLSLGQNASIARGAEPPAISTLLRPELFKRMMNDREILASADLEGASYSYYAAMLVKASPALTRQILTDYQLYSRMIPYVDKTDFSPGSGILNIEGGIWKFRLKSAVKFEDRGPRWVHYRIVVGHFHGLDGDIYFEPMGERGTAVYFKGSKIGDKWPPAFVIEQGAEMVFGFTAKKMRSYIEAQKDIQAASQEGDKNGQLPQPRTRLNSR